MDTSIQPEIDIDQVVVKYRHRLVGMLTKLTKDPDRAEDLAHETLIIVFRRIKEGSIREPDKLSAFIFSTARYLHIGWLRRQVNNMEMMGTMEDFECNNQRQEDLIESNQHTQLIQQSLDELRKPRDKDILTRRYLADQPKDEVCEALLLTSAHYDRVISRARRRLKEIAVRSEPQLANVP